jgi:hypothetical protein
MDLYLHLAAAGASRSLPDLVNARGPIPASAVADLVVRKDAAATSQPETLFDDLLGLVPASLYAESGELFYTGRAAFAQPSPTYLLGLNPGGNPATLKDNTIGAEITYPNRAYDWCAYADEPWQGYAAGAHPYQASILHMYRVCGLDARKVPASNAIFVRTMSEADVATRKAELLRACWPVHAEAIARLGVGVVVCLGKGAGGWVRSQLGATNLIETYQETNARGWPSSAHLAPNGVQVVTLTHPSRANWTNPLADPSELVRRALARAADMNQPFLGHGQSHR